MGLLETLNRFKNLFYRKEFLKPKSIEVYKDKDSIFIYHTEPNIVSTKVGDNDVVKFVYIQDTITNVNISDNDFVIIVDMCGKEYIIDIDFLKKNMFDELKNSRCLEYEIIYLGDCPVIITKSYTLDNEEKRETSCDGKKIGMMGITVGLSTLCGYSMLKSS